MEMIRITTHHAMVPQPVAPVYVRQSPSTPVVPPPASAWQSTEIGDLVRAAKNGDRSALNSLILMFDRRVRGWLRSRVSYAAVEDMVQDVFVKMLRNLHNIQKPESFSSFMLGMTINVVRDSRKKATRRDRIAEAMQASGMIPSEEPVQPSHVGAIEQSEEMEALSVARSRLSQTQRDVLDLHIDGGLSLKETGERLGISVSTVAMLERSAIVQLAQWMCDRNLPQSRILAKTAVRG